MRKAILHLKKTDPILNDLIDRIGSYGIEFLDPEFETLVKSIVYQQLSGKVAAVIFGRLVSACPDGKLTPQAVLKLRPARMRKAGLSQQKTDYIRDLARRTAAGEVDFSALPGMNDEGVIECLTRVRGIGVWTAHMFLIFALRRPNVLPTEDLGIRVAIKKAYGLTDLPKPAEVAKLGEAWRPWATVASWYLWRSLESKAGL